MKFIYFLQSLLNTIKRKFLTYKADYIHIFLKPLATTHLLGTNTTIVTLNYCIEIQFETKNLRKHDTLCNRQWKKQKVIWAQISELLEWKKMDTSHFKHLLLWFMTAGSLMFLQFVSTAHIVHVNRSLSCRENYDSSQSLDLYFTTCQDPPEDSWTRKWDSIEYLAH